MSNEVSALHEVIWGSAARFVSHGSSAVLNSWLEARLEWSPHEDFALVQRQGGPCVILAPLQAYIVSVLKDEVEASKLASGNDSIDEACDDTNNMFTVDKTRRDEILEKAILKVF